MIANRSCQLAWLLAVGLCMGLSTIAWAQEDPTRSEVEAPPKTRSLSRGLGGAYYVDEALLDRYDALKARLKQVRDDIEQGKPSSAEALDALAAIEEEAKALRAEIDQKKVFVAAFQVYSQKTEQTFPLGDERLVIITGDDIVVRGWEGPGIKCVLEKKIIAKSPPAQEEFDAIHMEHALRVAEDKVGLTREQRDQQEEEFLKTEQGQKFVATEQQRMDRRRFLDEIHHSYDAYLQFQGREANDLQLKGISGQDGNVNLTMVITSPGGGGGLSSEWQRHASLTVYVPPCTAVALRGCLVGVDVQNVESDLVLTTHDSRDRNYEGSFSVHGVKGNVHIEQVPIRVLSGVTGNVRVIATNEFVNSGTRHENDTRTFRPFETHTTRINHVFGDVAAHFLRTNLELSEIRGRLDIMNEYGSTRIKWKTVDPDRAHRIVSHSGPIHVTGPAEVIQQNPIYAYTQCGQLHTNLRREVLDSVDFSSGTPQVNWHGMVTPSKERFDFALFMRPKAILENGSRVAGLDLISHAGSVTILQETSAEK